MFRGRKLWNTNATQTIRNHESVLSVFLKMLPSFQNFFKKKKNGHARSGILLLGLQGLPGRPHTLAEYIGREGKIEKNGKLPTISGIEEQTGKSAGHDFEGGLI